MDRRRAPTRRLRRIVPAGCGALAVLMVAGCTADEPAQPATAAVERGVVSAGVSATGSMSAITQQKLGFPDGGRLTNVFVKVGQKVEAGQVLATVDDFALRQTLAQQQGQLQSQQALLDRLVNSPVVAGAKDSLSAAEDILEATHKQNDAMLDADDTAIDNAERQLAADREAEDDAEDRLEASRRACDSDDGDSGTPSVPNSPSLGGEGNDAGRSSDQDGDDGGSDAEGGRDSDDSDDSGGDDGDSGDDSDGSVIQSSWTGSNGSPGAYIVPVQTDPACSAIPSNQAAVTAAEQKVVTSKNAVRTAKEQRDIHKANGDLAVQNAEQAVVNAQNTADSESSDRPFDIEQQRGVVASAQAAVASAQRDVDNASLEAPVAGTVSVVNGVVGEFLSPGSGTSALAPGSSAPIPGTDSTSGGAAAAQGPAAPTRPGGTEFLVLDNIDAFQVVVPFNESDAAKIEPNQKVNVAVDALPDLTLTGTVLSVAPTGTDIAGVISYYVTVVVNGADPRLKDGQTVRATVVTQEVDNTLTVPSAAVRQENGRSTVTVVDPSGTQKSIPFEAGMAGPDRTQVLSGLREGQQVLLPVAK